MLVETVVSSTLSSNSSGAGVLTLFTLIVFKLFKLFTLFVKLPIGLSNFLADFLAPMLVAFPNFIFLGLACFLTGKKLVIFI